MKTAVVNKERGAGVVDLSRMPSTFAELESRCRSAMTTGKNINEPFHLLERTFLVGEGEFRIYLLLNRVSNPTGVHWFGFIMAPVAGDLNNDTIPYRDWGTERNLHASGCFNSNRSSSRPNRPTVSSSAVRSRKGNMASANPYRERPRPNGGLEATPLVFDDAIINTPVLYGELFPLVTAGAGKPATGYVCAPTGADAGTVVTLTEKPG